MSEPAVATQAAKTQAKTQADAAQTIVIAAGGTGGHVFPALAVASVLRERDIPVLWVGSQAGMENQVVTDNGIPIRQITVSPLRGGGLLRKSMGVVNLIKAIASSLKIVRQVKPRTVLGMGGYVSGPVCIAARLTGCRMVVHEQNAVPGFTNRVLGRIANRVLEAIPNTFRSSNKITCTGNPVRRELLEVDDPEVRYSQRQGPLRVLVIGGSQGARALNTTVPQALALLHESVTVIHQCGKRWRAETEAAYSELSHEFTVKEFIQDMADVYSWADIIVCRSGAMTVAEVAAVGLASILVPFPAAVDDHQTINGAYLVDAGAAVMVQESDMTAQTLADQIQSLSRTALQKMASNARRVSKRDATDRVVAVLTGAAA